MATHAETESASNHVQHLVHVRWILIAAMDICAMTTMHAFQNATKMVQAANKTVNAAQAYAGITHV